MVVILVVVVVGWWWRIVVEVVVKGVRVGLVCLILCSLLENCLCLRYYCHSAAEL